MKIVHYLDAVLLERGGVVRAVLDICAALASRGNEVVLLTADDTDAPSEWRRGGAPSPGAPTVVRLSSTPSGAAPDRAGFAEAAKWIEWGDALHLHTPWDRANPRLGALARKAKTPYALSPHGMLDDWSMSQKRLKKRAYLAFVGRRLLDGAAVIHCTAEGEKRQVARWVKHARLTTASLVVDLAPYRNPPGPEAAREQFTAAFGSGEPVALFLSRIHPKKGLHILINAFGEVRRKGESCSLIIAGTGDERYVQSLRTAAKRAGVDDSVFFVGHVDGELKVSLYQAADVFALPTSQENFGFVLFEALAAGAPVLTTRLVDTWPELEESGGVVFAEQRSESVADALSSLFSSREKRIALGKAGRGWALRMLEPGAVTERLEGLYKNALVSPASDH